MTWAVDQPHRHQWVRRSEVVTPSGVRATVRPLGAAWVGLLSALVGAWGAICVFVGPYFDYRPTTATTWEWTTNNWLLHLLPGAVAVAAAVMILTLSPVRRASSVRGPRGLAALLLTAAGVWFVIGPALWPTFQSSPAYATGTGPWTSFWNQLGANLGPGLLLAFFGGMALKASIARPAIAVGEPVDAGDPGVATAGTRGATAGTRGATAPLEERTARDDRAAPDERAGADPQLATERRRGTVTPDETRAAGERDVTTSQSAVGEDPGGPAPDADRVDSDRRPRQGRQRPLRPGRGCAEPDTRFR